MLRFVVFLAFLVTTAGCLAAKDEPAEATPPDATPTIPPSSGSPTPPSSAPAQTTNASREPLAIEIRHDFREPAASVPFEIPAGARNVRFQLHLEGADGSTTACPGVDIEVTVKSPSGDDTLVLAPTNVIVTDTSGTALCGDRVDSTVAQPPAGAWTVEFRGSGATVGVLEVGERSSTPSSP